MLDHGEIVRLYGPWRARTPQDAAALMEGYDRPWWIAGGWAIEAYTGIARPHDDVDPSILRADAHALLEHLSGRLDVWQADSGTLGPLMPGEGLLSDECENLWLRPSGGEPWEYDVILMHATPTTWTFKRGDRISLPLADILWERDGITYLRPEVQLLHKARAMRPKDQVDVEARDGTPRTCVVSSPLLVSLFENSSPQVCSRRSGCRCGLGGWMHVHHHSLLRHLGR